jgi:hypothetical protein
MKELKDMRKRIISEVDAGSGKKEASSKNGRQSKSSSTQK